MKRKIEILKSDLIDTHEIADLAVALGFSPLNTLAVIGRTEYHDHGAVCWVTFAAEHEVEGVLNATRRYAALSGYDVIDWGVADW